MREIEKALIGNAIRSLDLLHRVLFVWALLALTYLLLPGNITQATVKLSFSDLQVPASIARLLVVSLLFLVPFIGHALLDNARRAMDLLAEPDRVVLISTYPSLATTEARSMRLLFGFALVYTQYWIALGFITPSDGIFWDYRFGMAFAFCAPMVFFTSRLRWWDDPHRPR